MLYNKLVIMQWQNFDKRNSDLFAIPELIKRGIKVEYWDVSAISIPGYQVHPYPSPDGLVVRKVDNKIQFVELLKSNNNGKTVYLVHMTYCNHSFLCYYLLSKYKCTIIYCVNGCIPDVASEYHSSISYVKSLPVKRIINLIKQKIYNAAAETTLISPTDYLLSSCKEAQNRKECKIGKKTIWVDYNSCDYQQCIDSKSNVKDDIKNAIVFIDQNLPFHPDNKLEGLYIDAEKYFWAMNKLFDAIEDKYGRKIVIAAHPSCYDSYINGKFFKERRVVQGCTLEAVRDSWAVVAHNSTAISFPIIFKKPLILVTTEDMHSVRKHTCAFCTLYSKLLNCVYVKSENEITLPDNLGVDESAYNSFKYQYLTNQASEGVSNGDILFDILTGRYSRN